MFPGAAVAKQSPVSLCGRATPFPLSSRPEESWAFGPPKAMKNGSCSATTLNGSGALPFVISTGAQRSGEICGVSGPSLGSVFRPERSVVERSAVSAVSSWATPVQKQPSLEALCHLERAYPDLLLRAASDVHCVRLSVERAAGTPSKPRVSTGNPGV